MSESRQAAERAFERWCDDCGDTPLPDFIEAEFAPLLAAKDAENRRLTERLDVFKAWKDGIESSGDVDGWGTAFQWKKTQLSAEAERDRLAAQVERLRELVKSACETIYGLSEQQAMPDDWYLEPLNELRSALTEQPHA